MRKLIALLAATTAFTVAFDAIAEDAEPAEEVPTIQMGKITEFNGTWEKAASIDTRLDELEANVAAAHEQTKTAAGVATDAPLEKAFEDIKATAGDKLVGALEGDKVTVSATEDAPENVKEFAAAANKAGESLEAALKDATKLKEDAQALIEEATAIPSSITPDLIKNAGMKKPKDIKAEKDLQAGNVAIVKTFPAQADGVISAATEFVTLAKSLIP